MGPADAVMTAHVFNAQLDPTYPATLSAPVITGILREELGYDGVVITDDMNMGAITAQYGFEQAAVLAVQAGADVLAYGNNLVYDPDVAARAITALLAAVARGELSEERIDESYRRVLALKDGACNGPRSLHAGVRATQQIGCLCCATGGAHQAQAVLGDFTHAIAGGLEHAVVVTAGFQRLAVSLRTKRGEEGGANVDSRYDTKLERRVDVIFVYAAAAVNDQRGLRPGGNGLEQIDVKVAGLAVLRADGNGQHVHALLKHQRHIVRSVRSKLPAAAEPVQLHLRTRRAQGMGRGGLFKRRLGQRAGQRQVVAVVHHRVVAAACRQRRLNSSPGP